MSPQSILIGQIVLVFTTIILTTWYATQWVALQFDYDAYLGAPWFTVSSYKIYFPWRLFEWWYSFDAYAPSVFAKGGQIAAGGGFLGTLFAIAGSVWRGRQAKKLTTFGSSQWASKSMMKQAGLFAEDGVFLGQAHDNYLRHNGPEHVMAIAPTRSGMAGKAAGGAVKAGASLAGGTQLSLALGKAASGAGGVKGALGGASAVAQAGMGAVKNAGKAAASKATGSVSAAHKSGMRGGLNALSQKGLKPISANDGGGSGGGGNQPDWAKKIKRQQQAHNATRRASDAIRSGDTSGGGFAIKLEQEE